MNTNKGQMKKALQKDCKGLKTKKPLQVCKGLKKSDWIKGLTTYFFGLVSGWFSPSLLSTFSVSPSFVGSTFGASIDGYISKA